MQPFSQFRPLCSYGIGKWRLIQKDDTCGPVLANRSNVDLKVQQYPFSSFFDLAIMLRMLHRTNGVILTWKLGSRLMHSCSQMKIQISGYEVDLPQCPSQHFLVWAYIFVMLSSCSLSTTSLMCNNMQNFLSNRKGFYLLPAPANAPLVPASFWSQQWPFW